MATGRPTRLFLLLSDSSGSRSFVLGLQHAPDTPLTYAAAHGYLDAAGSELARGVSPDQKDGTGMTALGYAARSGNLEMMRLLLDNGASPNLRSGDHPWPPVLYAVHKKRMEAVRLLIERGADVNGSTLTGFTPLMMAAGHGNVPMVKLLLSAGADPLIRSNSGGSALTVAVSGAPDIEDFTLGDCQTATVRTLITANPKLKLSENSADRHAVWIARLGRCEDVLRLANGEGREVAKR